MAAEGILSNGVTGILKNLILFVTILVNGVTGGILKKLSLVVTILANGVTGILKKLSKLSSVVTNDITLVWDFNDKRQNLLNRLYTIIAVTMDAESKNVSKTTVSLWKRQLKIIAIDAEDILDECFCEVVLRRKHEKVDDKSTVFNKVLFLFSSFKPSFKVIQKLARQIKEIDERVKRIANSMHGLGLQTINWKIVGRENDKSKIINTLLDKDSCFVLSIAGMGGLGKTTLAQLVYNDEDIIKHFQLKIWILVSSPFDVKKLLINIVNSVVTDKSYDDASTMDDIEHGLRGGLIGKKFLLVLDNVWNENLEDWYKFKTPLVGGVGSKILVTTRSVKVAKLMENEFPHYELRILDDKDSWSLFKQIAFELDGGVVETPKLVEIGKTIVKKCGGLPLALTFWGFIMRSKKKEEEWKIIGDTKVLHDSLEGKNYEILSSIGLSYDNLSSPLKQCLSYCCLFPKNSIIRRETLIQLWMAEGFLIESPGKNAMSMKEIGNEYFRSLLCNFFFQDVQDYGCILTCKMNDLIHDLAHATAGNKECLIVAERSAHNVLYIPTTRRLQLVNDLDEEMLAAASNMLNEAKGLHSLFVKKTIRSVNIETVINNNKGLRVLDLSETDLEELPPSIGNLKHLRYLDLSHTNIKMLPGSITKLYNLQTLKLDATTKLPEGLNKLINLRHFQYLERKA